MPCIAAASNRRGSVSRASGSTCNFQLRGESVNHTSLGPTMKSRVVSPYCFFTLNHPELRRDEGRYTTNLLPRDPDRQAVASSKPVSPRDGFLVIAHGISLGIDE